MRWIACCVLVAGIGLAVSMTLIHKFGSKPTNPNLAEIGLSENLDQLAAPAEPEPVPSAVQSASAALLPPEPIDVLASSRADIPRLTEVRVEPSLMPVSYIDKAGTQALDDTAHRYMPRCEHLELKSLAAGPPDATPQTDHMPACDEPVTVPVKEKRQ